MKHLSIVEWAGGNANFCSFQWILDESENRRSWSISELLFIFVEKFVISRFFSLEMNFMKLFFCMFDVYPQSSCHLAVRNFLPGNFANIVIFASWLWTENISENKSVRVFIFICYIYTDIIWCAALKWSKRVNKNRICVLHFVPQWKIH